MKMTRADAEWEDTKILIFETMRAAIIRNPKKVLHGNFLICTCPAREMTPKGWKGQRWPYLGSLEGDAEVVVRTVDSMGTGYGIEVFRGDLGHIWFSPAFDEHRYAFETRIPA